MAIITISRGTFSGGQNLAECIAAKLGYSCISRQVLVNAASKYGVPLQKLSDALEEPPGFLQRLTKERAHYLTYIRAALAREVKDNNVVYHGLAGHLLLGQLPALLKVRVIAGMEFRIKHALERHNFKKEEEAIEFIKKVDERRARWTKFLYHVDWTEPSLYDIVINLNNISLDGACEILSHTVGLSEFKVTSEIHKVMEDLYLSTEVRALIASNSESKGIDDLGVEIQVDGGVITISGTVGSLDDADKIREIVKQVPDITGINSKMKLRRA